MQEIERKFLLSTIPANLHSHPSREIAQGYLVPTGEIEVRLRGVGEQYWLTVKRRRGLVRDEVELPLSKAQWDELWPLTEGRRLQKIRYLLPCGDWQAEVDVYSGRNEGMVVVEVEFPSEAAAHAFMPPDWFGAEVTGDPRYSNPLLAVE